MNEHSIVVEGLRKNFQGVKAVDKISFKVRKGEFFGILGPNGAGKTTTIRMLTGVLKPDGGSVHIDGIDMRRDSLAAKRRMGVIPEVGTVYIDLTARDNLELFGMYYGLSRESRRARADQLLQDFGLHHRADDPVKQFSKGMRQRISIGCAMVHDPSVLFLDEPTEGLDVQSRRLILERVQDMNAKGCTVILTTHNIEEASRLCDRVAIINKGQLVTVDSPESLKSTFEETRSVEVVFDQPVPCDDFDSSCVLKAEEHGDTMRLYTSDPDRTVQEVMRMRDERGLKILSICTLGPSLEDVFVRLTGEGRG